MNVTEEACRTFLNDMLYTQTSFDIFDEPLHERNEVFRIADVAWNGLYFTRKINVKCATLISMKEESLNMYTF